MGRQQVLVTRPEPGAGELARAVEGMGARAVVSPLMSLVPLPFDVPSGLAGLIVTSRSGARALGRWRMGRPRRAWCVGERTERELRDLGYEALAVGGDAETLAGRLPGLAEGPLLHVRGVHARGDVAARLSASGLPCAEAIAYDQPALPLTQEARTALAGPDALIVPLYSPRAARLLIRGIAEMDGNARAPLHIVAMSDAVAREAPGPAQIAARPDAEAMLEAIAARLARGGAGLDQNGRRGRGEA